MLSFHNIVLITTCVMTIYSNSKFYQNIINTTPRVGLKLTATSLGVPRPIREPMVRYF